MKQTYPLSAGILLALLGVSAHAHTAWLEAVDGHAGDYRLMFGGHAGKIESYDPAKLKTIEARDARGKQLAVTKSINNDGVLIHVEGKPTMLTMHFDNGIHSRVANGPSVPKPMNEVPGAASATYAVKFHKTVAAWNPSVTKAIGQPFEVVPLDAVAPVAGQPIRVRVLSEGKPVAGVKLGHGEEGKNDPVTDANGVGTFVPQKGFNRVWAGKRLPVEGNAKYTELSYEYSFSFNAE